MTDTRTIMACIDLSDYSPMTLGHGHGLELGTTRRYQGHRLLRLGPDIIHFKKPSLGFLYERLCNILRFFNFRCGLKSGS